MTATDVDAELAAAAAAAVDEVAAETAAERERRARIEAAEQAVRVEVGERLRRLRAAAGLSLAQAAAKSAGEFPGVVLGSYERGDRTISVPRLVRLCELYGGAVGDVLPLSGPADDDRSARAAALHMASRHLAEEAARLLSEGPR